MQDRNSLEIYIDGLNHGGAEHLLLNLLPTLKQHFARVEVFTLKGKYSLDTDFAAIVPVTKVSIPRLAFRLWRSQSTCHINLAKCGIIALSVAALRFAISGRRSAQFVCHEHSSFAFFNGRPGVKGLIDVYYRFVTYKCIRHRIVSYVISTHARLRELTRLVGNPGPVLLFPNSFSAERIASLRRCRGGPNLVESRKNEEVRFFTLSRLDEVKQLHWAIDAVASLAEHYPETHFTLAVCGQGPALEFLQQRAAAYAETKNLRIQFPGFVPSFEVQASISQYFLFPSRSEGFPLSLTEAALTGITAVANDCPHGPADLAAVFDNVSLATPPSRENFVAEVAKTYSHRLNVQRKSDTHAAVVWPTAEELAEKLAQFMSSQAKSSS